MAPHTVVNNWASHKHMFVTPGQMLAFGLRTSPSLLHMYLTRNLTCSLFQRVNIYVILTAETWYTWIIHKMGNYQAACQLAK